MNHDYQQTEFSKTLLTGVFTGIIATCVNLVYNFIYRGMEGFYPSEIINVSSIIFITMILFVAGALAYFMLTHFAKKGNLIYIVVFSILTLLCIYFSLYVNRSNNPVEIEKFRGLLLGTVALTGVMLAVLVPYLSKHSESYI